MEIRGVTHASAKTISAAPTRADEAAEPRDEVTLSSSPPPAIRRPNLASEDDSAKALADKLAEIEKSGFTLMGEGFHGQDIKGAAEAYLSLREGKHAYFLVGGCHVARTTDPDPRKLDALLEPHLPLLEAHRTVLAPARDAGRLASMYYSNVMQDVNKDIPGVNADRKARAFVALADALGEGVDRKDSLDARTTHCLSMFETLADKYGNTFDERLPVAVELARNLGSWEFNGACTYLWETIPAATPFPEARAEREAIFRRLASVGLPVSDTIRATETIAERSWSESITDRVDAFESVVAAARLQPGYKGMVDDFQSVMRYRLPGQSATEAARTYCRLLEPMAVVGQAEAARGTYSFLQEALRHGRLPVSTTDEVVTKFVQSFVINRDLEKARAQLLAQARPVETVERGEEFVTIGGIRVPVKR